MLEVNDRNSRLLSYLGAKGSLGQAVLDLAEKAKFYAVSADLAFGSGIYRFSENYPDRYIDVGIAEQNMVAIAAGLASEEVPVIAASWGAFASYRCADQIRCFLGLMHSNVKIIGAGSGFAEARFGGSHFGIGDLALLRSIPGIDVIVPCDGLEIYFAMSAVLRNNRPTYIRLTGGDRLPIINQSSSYHFQIGKANLLQEGRDVLIVGCGNLLSECLKAASILLEKGISAAVLNMHTIKPLDSETLLSDLTYRLIVTVEEHNVMGGLGSAVAEALASVKAKPVQIRLGIEDFMPDAGEYGYLLECCNLTGDQIASRILREMD